MQQQVLMNSLMSWFHQHVKAASLWMKTLTSAIAPTAVLWGMGPILAGSLATSAWTAWFSRHTAMQQVAGWQPVGRTVRLSPVPGFSAAAAREGRGLTPRGRAGAVRSDFHAGGHCCAAQQWLEQSPAAASRASILPAMTVSHG
jgi:hypothetical protein